MEKVKKLQQEGYVFLMTYGYNRAINRNHVKRLMKNVKEIGAFISPIVYIDAGEYFKAYPDRVIKLESGKKISTETPGLDKILFILEGQHRYEADRELDMEEGYESTLKAVRVELLNNITPDEWMTTVNTSSRNWDERDRARYINALNPDEETNVSLASEWREKYGMSERACYLYLNFSDNYKKSYHLDYMKNPQNGLPPVLKGTEENRKRGKDTLEAVEVGFRKYPKVLKNMSVINFIINDVYSLTPDEEKTEIIKDIQLFFKTLQEDDARKFATTTDKTEKGNILKEAWNDFKENLNAYGQRMQIEEDAKKAEEDCMKIQIEKEEKAKKKK